MPVIESCTVVSDTNGEVVRDVVFKKGAGPKDKAREVCRGNGSWVSFTRSRMGYDGADGEIGRFRAGRRDGD